MKLALLLTVAGLCACAPTPTASASVPSAPSTSSCSQLSTFQIAVATWDARWQVERELAVDPETETSAGWKDLGAYLYRASDALGRIPHPLEIHLSSRYAQEPDSRDILNQIIRAGHLATEFSTFSRADVLANVPTWQEVVADIADAAVALRDRIATLEVEYGCASGSALVAPVA